MTTAKPKTKKPSPLFRISDAKRVDPAEIIALELKHLEYSGWAVDIFLRGGSCITANYSSSSQGYYLIGELEAARTKALTPPPSSRE